MTSAKVAGLAGITYDDNSAAGGGKNMMQVYIHVHRTSWMSSPFRWTAIFLLRLRTAEDVLSLMGGSEAVKLTRCLDAAHRRTSM